MGIKTRSAQDTTSIIRTDGHDKLSCWFELSYAAWLTLPRVLMEDMSDEWQGKMADLLNEIDEAFPSAGCGTTRVTLTKNGKLIKMPEWLKNYRHPDQDAVNEARNPSPTKRQ